MDQLYGVVDGVGDDVMVERCKIHSSALACGETTVAQVFKISCELIEEREQLVTLALGKL